MILSILIATLNSRKEYLQRLLDVLEPQLTDDVEILIAADDGQQRTGAKRNALLQASSARYISFIDDDDLVSPDYVASILTAAETDADAIGFYVKRYHDDRDDGKATHSIRYRNRAETIQNGVKHHERPINHLNPIKREIALAAQFPDWTIGEDNAYADKLRDLLKSETFINKELYTYFQMPNKEKLKIVVMYRVDKLLTWRDTVKRYAANLSGAHDVRIIVSGDASAANEGWVAANIKNGSYRATANVWEAMPDADVEPYHFIYIASDNVEVLKGYDDKQAKIMRLYFPRFDGCTWRPTAFGRNSKCVRRRQTALDATAAADAARTQPTP